jgi:hypothetical protein
MFDGIKIAGCRARKAFLLARGWIITWSQVAGKDSIWAAFLTGFQPVSHTGVAFFTEILDNKYTQVKEVLPVL